MSNTFEKDLENLINFHSKEHDSNTPDFILAQYLLLCLDVFARTVQAREDWYGKDQKRTHQLAGGE